MSLAATFVQHGHNREKLKRPGETVCVALDACDGRLPKFRNIVFFGARYKHSKIDKASMEDSANECKEARSRRVVIQCFS